MAPAGGGSPPGPSPGLDLRATLGPAFAEPFAENCAQFSRVCTALFDERENIASKLGEFLFGAEDDLTRALNDTGAAVRSTLASAGMGGWVDTLLGAAPERPAPHSHLVVRRGSPQPFGVEFERLQEPPACGSGAQPVAAELCGAGDVWLSAFHVAVDPENCGDSDLRVTAAVGSEPELVARALEYADRHLEALAWLASDAGDAADFKRAVVEAFPHLAGFTNRFLDVPSAKVAKRKLASGTVELTFDAPLDCDRAASFYPLTAELLCLFDPLVLRCLHPVTGAVLFEYSLREGQQHLGLFVRGGELAWEGGPSEAAAWSKDGLFVADVAIECSVVPLGLSMAAIPLPETRLRCLLDRRGHLHVTCVEAGEPAFPTVAAAAFDVEHFRKLLVEGFMLQLGHVAAGDGRWAVRLYNRFMFPTASVAKLVSQWFRDFSLRQVRELDAPKAVSDLFEAAARDAVRMRADGCCS